MTDAAPAGTSPKNRGKERQRTLAKVPSLDWLLGAHPDALRDLFLSGTPTDPADFAGDARGLILAVERFADTHVLMRPLVKLVSSRMNPWQGIRFSSGGTSGQNLVLGRRAFRFRCELASSALDGQPALVMCYDGLGNRWPVSHLVDELRDVGEGIAIGPTSLATRRGLTLLSWWGITSAAAGST